MPDVIYDRVIEVKERVCLVQENCQLNIQSSIVTGTTGEQVNFSNKRKIITVLIILGTHMGVT